MFRKSGFAALLMSCVLSHTALAAVPADEAAQLGNTLTPWGAEKAGDKSGSIPEYKSMALKPPPGYDPKKPEVRPDIFEDEKPLYTVTAQNIDKYTSVLSDGLVFMLKKYPGFHIDVYPTHRTARFPKYIEDNSIRNATECKTTNNGLAVEGCAAGVPFPIPKTGNEMMWNHILRYGTTSEQGRSTYTLVDNSGTQILEGANQCEQEYPFLYKDNVGQNKGDSPYWLVRCDTDAPAREAGQKLIVIDHLDSVNVGRRAWQYIPGQRRVKLSPVLAYDTPNPQSGGSSLMDDVWLFNGAQDRFDFKLVGKREMLIPYNTYKAYDPKVCPASKMLTKNFMDPNCVRFELHRVWEVDATLKPQFRHAYGKRKFYFDEDMTGAGWSDNYDMSGKLYRSGMTLYVPWYEVPDQGMADSFVVFDHVTGSYMASINTLYPSERKDPRFFSPDALAGASLR